nr:Uncharacterised protein [Ipomoea batatas]
MCTSSMTNFPLGFKSARKGTSSLTFWKSSRCSCNPTDLAIAIKCRTALVDPPSAMTITIAFRSDFGVMMSRGFKSIFSKSKRYLPARRHSSNFRGSSAGVEELLGRDIPIVSIADAIVFAVYIPPQAPAPGHEVRITFILCSSLTEPLTYSP